MKLFLLLILFTLPCLAQDDQFKDPNEFNDISPYGFESQSKRIRRGVNQAQKALYAVPSVKQKKRHYEKKITQLLNKEFMATMGMFYIAFNKKEVSTRYIKNFSTPAYGGTFRPDIGFQIEQDNFYWGLSYTKAIP